MRFSGSAIKILLIPLTALIVLGMLIFLRSATDGAKDFPENLVLDLGRCDIAIAEPETTENPLVRWNKYERMLSQDIAATNTVGEVVPLRAGQVVFVYTREEHIIDASSRFFSYDEEELYFDRTINEYNTLLLSGIPADLLLIETDDYLFEEKSEIIGEEWVTLRGISSGDRVVYQVDWDGDGEKDEVIVEPVDGRIVRVSYFNGANGDFATLESRLTYQYEMEEDFYNDYFANIEFSEYLTVYWGNFYLPHDYLVLLYRNSSDRYVIMIGKELFYMEPNGFDPVMSFVSSDPIFGLAENRVVALYEYDGHDFYRYGISRFLGDIWTTREKVVLNDDYTTQRKSDTIEYLNGCVESIHALRPIQVEVQGSGGFYSSELASGTTMKPIRLVIDKSGEGYLYITLSDGKIARIQTSFDEENNVGMIDGGPQSEAVVCYKAEVVP